MVLNLPSDTKINFKMQQLLAIREVDHKSLSKNCNAACNTLRGNFNESEDIHSSFYKNTSLKFDGKLRTN